MDREEALKFVESKVTNQNILKHMLATEAVMRGLSRKFESNKEKTWALAGLLHDGDYKIDVPVEKQGILITQWVRQEKQITLPASVTHAMASHNPKTGVKPESKMDWALFACDSLTGLIIASTLVLPCRKINDLTIESVLKRFKEPKFAKGTRREDILEGTKHLEISLELFVKISLQAMKDISESLGL
ncbi:MAG: phosphohydrolase [Candidatus Daviesbacteria bacterium]|nr:phosphohydrolase [Candidatus Daviesbacteria bacterium]